MTEPSPQQTLDSLDEFVGEWSMRSSLAPDPASAPRARTTFEWLPGRQFLVQRWEVDHPDAPDGIAIIGPDAEKAALLQHYFDSRGTARVYRMTFARQVLDAPWIGRHPRVLAALHRHPRRRHDRRPLGDLERRHELEPRFRPHLHTRKGARLSR